MTLIAAEIFFRTTFINSSVLLTKAMPRKASRLTAMARVVKKALPLLFCASALFASVPERVSYQGRLHKSGVAITGEHTIVIRLLSSNGNQLWSSGPISVNVPATGDFTLTFEPSGVDWEAHDPRFEISVDGETLSPTDTFSSTPYSFLARNVVDGAVGTAELAAAAVTNEKVALGVASSKILLEGSSPAAYLAAWQSTATPHLIDGAKVAGTVLPGVHGSNHVLGQGDAITGLDRGQVNGTALLAFSTFTQRIEPTENTLPIVVKPRSGSNPNSVHIMEWQNESGGTEMLLRGTGDLEVSGRVRDATGLVAPSGAVMAYAGSAAPAGWLMCDGAAVSRSTYADLFAAIGTAFGPGDGSSTFNLPDLRGRAPIGAGQGSGLTNRTLGGVLGVESHAHTVNGHTHSVGSESPGTSNPGDHQHVTTVGSSGTTSFFAYNAPYGTSSISQNRTATTPSAASDTNAYHLTSSAGGHSHSVNSHNHGGTTGSSGPGSDTVSNLQPSLVLNFIIKT
jgi:microcystin-dependent protein